MSNPFSGIITSEMKTLHKNMIDALLYDDACTVACRLIFEGSLHNSASPSIGVDPLGNKPPSVFPHGGPWFNNVGPSGSGYEPNEETTTINMMVIWDSKDWIRTSFAQSLVNAPEVYVQTITFASNLTLLKQADKMVVDTTLETQARYTFTRHGEPEPCGFGANTHIVTMWKKIG